MPFVVAHKELGAFSSSPVVAPVPVDYEGCGCLLYLPASSHVARARGACWFDASVVQLGGANSYKILSQSDCTTLDGVDDAEEFRGVKAAFDTIGMDDESQMQVWKMLASVLYMSNLEFDTVDHEQGEIASISDREVCTIRHTHILG